MLFHTHIFNRHLIAFVVEGSNYWVDMQYSLHQCLHLDLNWLNMIINTSYSSNTNIIIVAQFNDQFIYYFQQISQMSSLFETLT